MRNLVSRLAWLAVAAALSGLLIPVSGAGAKPDRKKSLEAFQRGLKADQEGSRDEAITA